MKRDQVLGVFVFIVQHAEGLGGRCPQIRNLRPMALLFGGRDGLQDCKINWRHPPFFPSTNSSLLPLFHSLSS